MDPIINDSLGAIFPSKRFGSGGIKLIRSDYQDKPLIISIEHINTDSGWKNVVYNHSIYKTGYRYYDLPIGANIDADSHQSIISFEKKINSFHTKFKIKKISINQNNSNAVLYKEININEFSLDIIKTFINLELKLIYSIRDDNNEYYKKNFLSVNFSYFL